MSKLFLVSFILISSLYLRFVKTDINTGTLDSSSSNIGYDERDMQDSANGNRYHNCYKGMRRDNFIDKDGDGVCDERESNVGIRHRRGWEK